MDVNSLAHAEGEEKTPLPGAASQDAGLLGLRGGGIPGTACSSPRSGVFTKLPPRVGFGVLLRPWGDCLWLFTTHPSLQVCSNRDLASSHTISALAYFVSLTACSELLEPVCPPIQSQAGPAQQGVESVKSLWVCYCSACLAASFPKSHQTLACALALSDDEN